jgi:hypothetical protein
MNRWAVFARHHFQNSGNVDVKGDTGSDGSIKIVGERKCHRERVGKGNKEPVSGTWAEE